MRNVINSTQIVLTKSVCVFTQLFGIQLMKVHHASVSYTCTKQIESSGMSHMRTSLILHFKCLSKTFKKRSILATKCFLAEKEVLLPQDFRNGSRRKDRCPKTELSELRTESFK